MIENIHIRRIMSRGVRSLLAVIALAACTEPPHSEQAKPAPAQSLEARVELSDSLAAPGSDVVVTVRFLGTPVASATARLEYDSTGATFTREEVVDDGATRVINPQPGAIRFAAVAPSGFRDGRMYALHFTVTRISALRAMRLVVDEVHTTSRMNAASLLRKP